MMSGLDNFRLGILRFSGNFGSVYNVLNFFDYIEYLIIYKFGLFHFNIPYQVFYPFWLFLFI